MLIDYRRMEILDFSLFFSSPLFVDKASPAIYLYAQPLTTQRESEENKRKSRSSSRNDIEGTIRDERKSEGKTPCARKVGVHASGYWLGGRKSLSLCFSVLLLLDLPRHFAIFSPSCSKRKHSASLLMGFVACFSTANIVHRSAKIIRRKVLCRVVILSRVLRICKFVNIFSSRESLNIEVYFLCDYFCYYLYTNIRKSKWFSLPLSHRIILIRFTKLSSSRKYRYNNLSAFSRYKHIRRLEIKFCS